MASLRVGDIEDFPFLDPPEPRAVRAGIDLLVELGAVDPDRQGTRRWLTTIGRALARLPVDPRYGRMLLAAEEEGCVEEVRIIVAALSVEDPRERPRERRQLADEAHARFRDAGSDFCSYLTLWDHLTTARRERSRNQFRRLCRREYLNYTRVIEWQDIHAQLREAARELAADRRRGRGQGRRRGREQQRRGEATRRRRDHTTDQALRDAIHRSLLAGLLSQVGRRDPKDARRARGRATDRGKGQRRARAEYLGARNTRFAIGPGSALARGAPDWVMAAELVETSRLWARTVAPVDPIWIEEIAEDLVTRAYGEPWWDPARGEAQMTERVTLFGLTIVADRAVSVRSVDRSLGRELFIHHALVERAWETDHRFAAANASTIADVEALEARTRRRDLLVTNERIHAFFDERIPDDVAGVDDFERWWGAARAAAPDLLDLTVDDLLETGPELDGSDLDAAFPQSWVVGDVDLEIVYEFDPTSPLDGASILVPIEALNELDPATFEWTVPGFRRELIAAVLRSLPKWARRELHPQTQLVAEVVDELATSPAAAEVPLLPAIADVLGRRTGVVVGSDELSLEAVPPHLRPTFRIINADYELLAEGKDLSALGQSLSSEVRTRLASMTADGHRWDRRGLTSWDVGTIPDTVQIGGMTAYPALVDDGDAVAAKLVASADERFDALWDGVRRLVRLNLRSPVRSLDALIGDEAKLDLATGLVQSRPSGTTTRSMPSSTRRSTRTGVRPSPRRGSIVCSPGPRPRSPIG